MSPWLEVQAGASTAGVGGGEVGIGVRIELRMGAEGPVRIGVDAWMMIGSRNDVAVGAVVGT